MTVGRLRLTLPLLTHPAWQSTPHWELEALAQLDPSRPNATKTLGFRRQIHANCDQIAHTRPQPASRRRRRQCPSRPKSANAKKKSGEVQVSCQYWIAFRFQDSKNIQKCPSTCQAHNSLTNLILALLYDTGPYQLIVLATPRKCFPCQWGLKKVFYIAFLDIAKPDIILYLARGFTDARTAIIFYSARLKIPKYSTCCHSAV